MDKKIKIFILLLAIASILLIIFKIKPLSIYLEEEYVFTNILTPSSDGCIYLNCNKETYYYQGKQWYVKECVYYRLRGLELREKYTTLPVGTSNYKICEKDLALAEFYVLVRCELTQDKCSKYTWDYEEEYCKDNNQVWVKVYRCRDVANTNINVCDCEEKCEYWRDIGPIRIVTVPANQQYERKEEFVQCIANGTAVYKLIEIRRFVRNCKIEETKTETTITKYDERCIQLPPPQPPVQQPSPQPTPQPQPSPQQPIVKPPVQPPEQVSPIDKIVEIFNRFINFLRSIFRF